MELRRRQALFSEREWLYRLHESAMRERAVAEWGPWDEPAQRSRFFGRPADCQVEVIEVHGDCVGSVQWRVDDDGLTVELIEVDPSRQGEGIGTAVLEELMEVASQARTVFRLRVNKKNRAVQLYDRLGLRRLSETETHIHLVAEPEARPRV